MISTCFSRQRASDLFASSSAYVLMHACSRQSYLTCIIAACHGAGTFVRFQPKDAGFQQAVAQDIETVLESTLLTRSTLTEGDWLSVTHQDRLWALRVQQLQPASQVSVIGESRSSYACIGRESVYGCWSQQCSFVQGNDCQHPGIGDGR